tara:strand:- start:308 stop:445 length:138 start_codon:yes stop_codon:yes gene_type:complete
VGFDADAAIVETATTPEFTEPIEVVESSVTVLPLPAEFALADQRN